MNILLEQMMMHRGATQHLAHLAMHTAGSMTREELVQARAVFDEVCADMVKIDDAFLEFEGSGSVEFGMRNSECGMSNEGDRARTANGMAIISRRLESGFDEPCNASKLVPVTAEGRAL